MRYLPAFLALTTIAPFLTGCGPDTSNDTAYNPATNVDLVFSTFDLEDIKDKPANLEHTRFYKFYRGIEPNLNATGAAAGKDIANALRDHIDVFIGAVRNDTDDGYKKLRNPIDLMNQVIAHGGVENFAEGRRYIRERISLGQAGTYDTRANGAQVRFVDQSATFEDRHLADRQWLYNPLRWNYTPNDQDNKPGFEKVSRVMQYIARQAPEGEIGQPELKSLTSYSRFDARTFSTIGYNTAELTLASMESHNFGSMELRQDSINSKTDTLFISGTDKVKINGATSDCIRAELDYDMQTLHLYTSDGELLETEDGKNNINHCSHKGVADESYATITLDPSSV